MSNAYEMTSSECTELLRAGVVGRVGIATPSGPTIVVVNYSVVDDAVVLRTSADGSLATYAAGALVAFEVDHVDHAHHRGWSVLARGRCEVVEDDAELDRIMRVWPPRPWVDDDRPLVLRIRWAEVSGRRVGIGWVPVRTLPVRRVVASPLPGGATSG